MDLPSHAPMDTATILAEVERAHAMEPAERMRSLHATIAEGIARINRSPDAAAIRAYLDEQEELGNRNVREFLARHAHLIVTEGDEMVGGSAP